MYIFTNWVDPYFHIVTVRLLPFVKNRSKITPNIISVLSFIIYLAGSVFLFLPIPYHLIFSALLLPIAYVGDQLDGQLARSTNQSTDFGGFLDNILDVIKIFFLIGCLSTAIFLKTHDVLYVYLGYISIFFFMFRCYLRLETVLLNAKNDDQYLKVQDIIKEKLENAAIKTFNYQNARGLQGKINVWWLKNRTIFLVGEGEIAFFVALGALFDKLDIVLYILLMSQVTIGLWRFYERGLQIRTNSTKLNEPIRR